MNSKINNSVVAQGGSTISNVNNKKQIHKGSALLGFVLGIFSSVIGAYLFNAIQLYFETNN